LWLQARGIPAGAVALHQAEWLACRLTGDAARGDENNCLKLGYDPVERRWPDWLTALPLPAGLLPPVQAVGSHLGRIDPRVAAATGLTSACEVVAGTTDSTAAAIAAGLRRPGDALTVLGSTLVLKVVAEQPVTAARFGVYSHRLGDLWLVGGASNSGGAVLRQFFSDAELERLTPRLRPDRASCLEYYPLPCPGERFPVSDPTLAPRIHPLPSDPARLLQGLLEGMARIEVQGYRRLIELGAPDPVLIQTSGGGARNDAWTRIRSRLLGRPVRRAGQEEAAFGAALLAAGLATAS